MSEVIAAQSRAAAGAKMFDTKEPNWFLRINVGLLDMGCNSRCIIGQLYEDYFDAIREGGALGDVGEAWLEAHGFTIDWDEPIVNFRDLTAAWEKEIAERLGLPVVV